MFSWLMGCTIFEKLLSLLLQLSESQYGWFFTTRFQSCWGTLVGCGDAFVEEARKKKKSIKVIVGMLAKPGIWEADILMEYIAHRKCRQCNKCMIILSLI